MGTPDFLAIGHVCKDLSPSGDGPGGAVTFAALTALKLGLQPAIITSGGRDVGALLDELGIPAHVVPSADTTTFQNTYSQGDRRQLIKSVAGPIAPHDVPSEWRSIRLVLLGPLADEVDYALARHFPDSLVIASIQGWLRSWDSDGRVAPKHWDGTDVLPYLDAAVVSISDIGDRQVINLWADIAPVLIVTKGSDGARLHSRGDWHEIAPFSAQEVDPTGAGDVFAAAYLIRYQETRDPVDAARFACCVASFCVEAEGVAGIPTRAQVERRMSTSAD